MISKQMRKVSKRFKFMRTISVNQLNYNLYNDIIASGWNGLVPIDAVVTINSGVFVGGSTTATPAFDTGVFPLTSKLSLINNGTIIGCGGKGGDGGGIDTPHQIGWPGYVGGNGLKIQYPLTITNTGWIYSGGGGGGGGGCAGSPGVIAGGGGGPGGGGAGYNIGTNGAAGSYYNVSTGQTAATTLVGASSSNAGNMNGYIGGGGGKGGNAGLNGNTGATAGSVNNYGGGAGALAGFALDGIANITWVSGNTNYTGRTQ